jgi:hypothetical protein
VAAKGVADGWRTATGETRSETLRVEEGTSLGFRKGAGVAQVAADQGSEGHEERDAGLEASGDVPAGGAGLEHIARRFDQRNKLVSKERWTACLNRSATRSSTTAGSHVRPQENQPTERQWAAPNPEGGLGTSAVGLLVSDMTSSSSASAPRPAVRTALGPAFRRFPGRPFEPLSIVL